MTVVRVRGFKIFRDRHGKMRCYHRRTGTPIDLSQNPIGSPGFFAECNRIAELANFGEIAKPGTLGLLISEYRASGAFLEDLAERTRSDYQRVFDYLRPIADTPLTVFNKPLVVRIRDKAGAKRGRRFGTYTKQVLSVLFGWGEERGYLTGNPARGVRSIRKLKGAPRANRPWSDEERYVVLDEAPWHLRVPIALAMFTGVRLGDAIAITRSAYDGSSIATTTRKSGQSVYWPCPIALKQILDSAPPHNAVTLAVNSHGRPWTQAGFRASWRKFRIGLEHKGMVGPGLTIHGLRHTVGTILAEEGFDNRTIADALGQATEAMAKHYSRDADRTRVMQGVVRRLDRSENIRRAKVVKPNEKRVKPFNSE